MIINELADHLITMALITQLNAKTVLAESGHCLQVTIIKGQQSIGKEKGSQQRKPVEQRFSLLNDAQNVSILILHAILVW